MITQARRQKALDILRPSDANAESGAAQDWQIQKRARTRTAILEAAVDIVVESGYARLTTIEVARRAGISRGAMHHHLPNRTELASALIAHVLYRRMHLYIEGYLAALPTSPEKTPIAEAAQLATDLNWESLQTREFAAYLELAFAARTDPELAAILKPAAAQFDQVWRDEMRATFPQWDELSAQMQLANDFVEAAHLGMLLNAEKCGTNRTDEMKKLVKRVMAQLHCKPE